MKTWMKHLAVALVYAATLALAVYDLGTKRNETIPHAIEVILTYPMANHGFAGLGFVGLMAMLIGVISPRKRFAAPIGFLGVLLWILAALMLHGLTVT